MFCSRKLFIQCFSPCNKSTGFVLHLLKQIVQSRIVSTQPLVCFPNHFLRNSKPSGHVKPIAPTRPACYQPISRFERPEVEFHGSVDGTGRLRSEEFESIMMRRNKRDSAALDKSLEYSRAQRCAFTRICARPEFIQEHQRALLCQSKNLGNSKHMGREATQVLFQTLLVADIGEDRTEARELAPFRCGYRQTRLRHKTQKSHGLQNHGLAARIRSAQDQ